jgi:hypothetical protein
MYSRAIVQLLVLLALLNFGVEAGRRSTPGFINHSNNIEDKFPSSEPLLNRRGSDYWLPGLAAKGKVGFNPCIDS